MQTQVLSPEKLQAQLRFQTELNRLTAKIHSAPSTSAILSEMPERISSLLRCERLTIYAVDNKNQQLFSLVKSGSEDFEVIRVPKDSNSIAGHCAVSGQTLNVADVYDEEALARIHPDLRFDHRWDIAMGFRSRQVLATPLLFERYLLGVLQMINQADGRPFSGGDQKAAEEIARTLAIALYNQNRARRPASGQRTKFSDLVERGLLTEKGLEEAVTQARTKSQDLGDVLLERGVAKAEIGQSLHEFFGCPFWEYDSSQRMPQDLLKGVRHDFWKRLRCAPLQREAVTLVLATADPYDLNALDAIKSVGIAPKFELRVALASDIQRYLDESFGVAAAAESEDELSEILTELQASGEMEEEDEDEDADIETEEVQGAVVRLANKIITDAYRQRVSDIHVEPYGKEQSCVIRFRRDGECYRYREIPATHRSALISRLKIMAHLDIAEKRKPQDGKIRFRLNDGNIIELRVAVIPTSGRGNEDMVMRILAASEPIPLEKIGMSLENLKRFEEIIQKPYGLVLWVGPTGSGKTTTLHSALGHINKDDVKIWTAEDPVEITQPGLRQVQVQSKIGFDFAAAMRAFLRADPDVIMIGEMRDQETASTGIEASLTGHLVLSTLHTNSAPETVTRLLDMELDPFNFADALLGVLAQRLVRTLCRDCKEVYQPGPDEVDELRSAYGPELFDQRFPDRRWPGVELHRARGCKACAESGYRGRMGLHELLLGTDAIKRLILTRQTVEEIRSQAIADGMTTLLQDGIWKVLEGHTDLRQVKAVCSR